MALTKLKTGSKDLLNSVNGNTLGVPTFTAAAEASNAIVVTIQLKDVGGVALAAKARATVWVSDTAGGVPSATAPNAATSFTTGTLLKETTTKVLWDVVSDATGVLVLSIGETGAKSFYVNVAMGGVVASSAAVTFT